MIYSLIVYDNSKAVTDIITFSTVSSFSEQYQSEITESAVEYGFKIADHIVTKSPEISVEAVLTDYTIYNQGQELFWDGSSFVTPNSVNGISNTGQSFNVKQRIIDIVKKRKLFTLIETEGVMTDSTLSNEENATQLQNFALRKFNNCAMPSLSFPPRNNTTDVVFVSFSVKQLRVAVTSVSNVDKKSIRPVTPVLAKATQTNIQDKVDANGKSIGDKKGKNSTPATVKEKALLGQYCQEIYTLQNLNKRTYELGSDSAKYSVKPYEEAVTSNLRRHYCFNQSMTTFKSNENL